MREFEDFDREFDREFARAKKFAIVWVIFCILVGLVVVGVGAWAIIELVQWVTTK